MLVPSSSKTIYYIYAIFVEVLNQSAIFCQSKTQVCVDVMHLCYLWVFIRALESSHKNRDFAKLDMFLGQHILLLLEQQSCPNHFPTPKPKTSHNLSLK